jgi:hypothetical protein
LTSAAIGGVLNHACDVVNERNGDVSPTMLARAAVLSAFIDWPVSPT